MTSKERAELRAQANTLDTTLIVGKGGVSETLVDEAARQLDARELVKGRVLEASLLSAREACDALCEALSAEGIQVVGSKFVIWRRSEKLAQQKKAAESAKKAAVKNVNPVKTGIRTRRKAAKAEKERRQKYFHDAAVQAAIERRKEREQK